MTDCARTAPKRAECVASCLVVLFGLLIVSSIQGTLQKTVKKNPIHNRI